MKKFLAFCLFVLFISGGFVVYVYVNLGVISQVILNKYGPQATQSDFQVRAVRVLPHTGSITVYGLTVGNPEGYKSDYAVKISEVTVELELRSLIEKLIVIKKVKIHGAKVFLEGDKKENNLFDIVDNAEVYIDKLFPPSGDPSKVQIHDFSLSKSSAQTAIKILGETEVLTLNIPDLHMENLGGEKGDKFPNIVGEVEKTMKKKILALDFGPLVKRILNKYGPRMTQTDFSVENVTIILSKGQIDFAQLKIGNPKGYKSKHAITVSNIEIRIDPKSLEKDPLVFKKILIEDYDANWEGGKSSSNILEITENVSSQTETAPAKNGPEKKIRIDDFYLKKGKAQVTFDFVVGQKVNLNIPTMHERNLGGPQGAPPKEVAAEIASKLNQHISTQILNAPKVIKMLGGASINAVGGLTKSAGGLVVGAGRATGNATKKVLKGTSDVVGGTLRGIGGIFGIGKSKEKEKKGKEAPQEK